MAQYKRIFAALDGASTQSFVAERALALAADNGAQLMFGHVVDSVPNEATGTNFEELRQAGAAVIEEELTEILNAARQNPQIASVDFQVQVGRINETLLGKLIEPFDADLVICGERGLSSIKYAFVGSVSTFLIRNLRCDVLVVKQD